MIKQNNQKGVSLIMTFFIMVIVLSVVLSISIILYSEMKVIRNMGVSVASFYAADSGIEKVLYYDRQVIPTMSGNSTAVRGLCSMYMTDPFNNPKACTSLGSNTEKSIYCTPVPGYETPVAGANKGCDYDICNNCTIYFSTTFDGRTYYTKAMVTPNPNPSLINPDFEIDSKGTYIGAQRQIQIFITPTQ